MYKVYCDMCGKQIDYNVDGVNLNMNCYGKVSFSTMWSEEKNLCLACAARVVNWIDSECAKIEEEFSRKNESQNHIPDCTKMVDGKGEGE